MALSDVMPTGWHAAVAAQVRAGGTTVKRSTGNGMDATGTKMLLASNTTLFVFSFVSAVCA